MARLYQVEARWDSEASVWVAESDDVPGLVAEAESPNALTQKLRGPAVWSPRAQCDKKQYRIKMRQVLESEPNLRIKQAEVAGRPAAGRPSRCRRSDGRLYQ